MRDREDNELVYVCVCMNLRMYVSVCVGMCVCVYVRTYVCLYLMFVPSALLL